MEKKRLLLDALVKLAAGLALLCLLLFLPAGTFRWPGAWRFLGLLFVPMTLFGIVLYLKAPDLLRKRLNDREKEDTQKGVVAVSGLLFIACFVIAGLDFRFGWTRLPAWLVWAACALFLASYGLYAEVMRENAYLSRTIEVQEGQKVVSTGLYGVVRHPMYFAVTLLFLSVPLVLGSLAALPAMLPFPFLLAVRIRNEEKVLEKGLEGYREYKEKVKYRLIPFVW